jgi:hypothetical protein
MFNSKVIPHRCLIFDLKICSLFVHRGESEIVDLIPRLSCEVIKCISAVASFEIWSD